MLYLGSCGLTGLAEIIKPWPAAEKPPTVGIPAEKLQPVLSLIRELLEPLVVAGSSAEIKRLLRFIFIPYGGLSSLLFYFLRLEYYSPEELIARLRQLNEEAAGLLRKEGPKFVDTKDLQQLLTAAEGVAAYSNAIAQCAINNDEQTAALLYTKVEQFLKASACVDAVTMVVLGEIDFWNRGSLSLLCPIADEYVLKFEDLLLAMDPELRKRLAEPEGTKVSFEQVAKELGLRY